MYIYMRVVTRNRKLSLHLMYCHEKWPCFVIKNEYDNNRFIIILTVSCIKRMAGQN